MQSKKSILTNNSVVRKVKAKAKSVSDSGFVDKNYFKLLYPWLLVAGLLIVLPILFLLLYSFYDAAGSSSFIAFTFSNYNSFFSSGAMWQVLFVSLFIGATTTVFTLIFGYPIAYALSEIKSKHSKKVMLILVTMPIWINMLIRIIAMQVVMQWIAPQLIGTYFAVILGMTYTFIPFMILPLYNHLNNRDRTLEQASRDLGASQWQTFRKITFPNSLPAIYSGSIMVLLPSMTSITVTRYMSGGSINNIGNILENLFVNSTDYSYGAAIAIITLLFMAMIIVVLRIMTKQTKKKTELGGGR